MAVYSKLLLSSGGGVISTQQQADQAQNTATVLIGLGGTGVDCIRTIKTQVQERLKPDDTEAVVATYSHIRFLGVDADRKSRGIRDPRERSSEESKKAGMRAFLDDTEFFDISNTDVKMALKIPKALEQRGELSWLRWEDISAPDLTDAGAGGIRQVGRYLMMDKSAEFMARVEQEIGAAKSGLAAPTVNVHIFAGLSGGTGSGAFLDVCYMVRSVAARVGGATVFGYVFLPDVNLSNIPLSATKVRAYIPINGYAAMQELDYCMELQFNGGSFQQEYQGHREIAWDTPPVDMCHLICATNAQGDVIPDAYNYAMSVTAEYLMDFLTFSRGDFDISSQLANFRQMVQMGDGEKQIGANLAYCVIGASCASIPLREINTYLASELFARFATIGGNVPTKADVEGLAVTALAKNAKSTEGIYTTLLREIRAGAGEDYSSYPDDWKFVRDYGNSEMVQHFTNQTASKLNAVEANAKSMTSEGNEQSLVGRINKELMSVLRDLHRGPIFAYRMLSAAESHNLLNIIDGLLADNNARWSQEAAQTDLRRRDYDDAKFAFENPKGLIKSHSKNFQDYEYYLMLLEQHKLSMEVFQKLDRVLRDFRRQIEEITARYYIKLARVLETLINSFDENRAALASERIMKAANSFAVPMMTIGELKKPLDEEIGRINIPGMLDKFMGMLIARENDWLQEDENKIARLVTRFFVDTAFEGFANRTITAFLKDKYDTLNDEQLTGYIYEDYMKLLTAKASPLFYFNRSIWGEQNTSKLSFISVPTASTPVKAAADKMFGYDDQWKVKESALTDRIYVMCSACALPLSAYNNCGEYEQKYFSTTNIGLHYYEGKPVPKMTFNDWRRLPSLTPLSMIEERSAPDPLRRLIAEADGLYSRADALGMFDGENRICRPHPADVQALEAAVAECERLVETIAQPGDKAEATAALERLQAAKTLRMEPSGNALRNDGFARKDEIKKSVQKDHFVASPAYHLVVRDILEVIEGLTVRAEKAGAALTARMSQLDQGRRGQQDFFDALFAGVISLEDNIVVYRHTEGVLSGETVLSRYGAEFRYKNIPVYQAYQSFRALDEGVRQQIRAQVDALHNENAAAIRENGRRMQAELAVDRIRGWVALAADYEEQKEIEAFLQQLHKSFETFCLGNRLS